MKLTHDYTTTLETQVKENRLIAEFMGLNPDVNGNYLIQDFPHIHATCWVAPEYLDFHTSWDWLMPVVEKIDSLNSYSAIHIDNDQVFVHFDRYTEMQDFLNKDYGGKIGAVYKAVTVFIHWFNSQNKV